MKKPAIALPDLIIALSLGMLVGVSLDVGKTLQVGSLSVANTVNHLITSMLLFFLLLPLSKSKQTK